MAIHFVCPLGHRLKVPDERAGKKGRCPVCNQRLIVPRLAPAPSGSVVVAPDRVSSLEGTSQLSFSSPTATDVSSPVTPQAEGDFVAEVETEAAASTSDPLPIDMNAKTVVADSGNQPPVANGLAIEPPPIPSAQSTSAIVPPPLPESPAPDALFVETSTLESNGAVVQRSVRWFAWRSAKALEGYAIYQPHPRQLEIAYWLAGLLPFAVAFCAAPALAHLQFSEAPLWAQLMLTGAVAQLGDVVWLAIMPDRSTVRVGIAVFAASAAAYFIGLIQVSLASDAQLASLGLVEVRWAAQAWCCLAVVLESLASLACGWVGLRWRA
jgi:hypothetical protein